MSGLKGITINTAPEAEAHILAEDDAAIYQSIVGADGVFNIGQKLEATIESNNLITIADGVLCVGGHFARVRFGDKIECQIANGQTGQNRNDLIVAKFQTTDGIDIMSIEVIEGVAGATATDPEISQEELYSGGTLREFPLYRVKIEGLSIVKVEPLFNIIPCINNIQKSIGSRSIIISGLFNGVRIDLRLRREGNVVTVALNNVITVPTENTLYNLALTIPVGYRPCEVQYVTAAAVSANNIVGHLRIVYHTEGNIAIISTYANIQEIHHSHAWITNDDMPE